MHEESLTLVIREVSGIIVKAFVRIRLRERL